MSVFIRCTKCIMPNTRPDTPFVNGVCQACINHATRQNVDWNARRHDLEYLLEEHDGRVLVASSGGKDSHAQVHILQAMGANVTTITAPTCQLTRVGQINIANLERYAPGRRIEGDPIVRAKLNRLGMELVGDISWPEHVGIFTMTFNEAVKSGRLMFFGENPQAEYGGPAGTENACEMTRRWVSEFGGFLGLRPSDMIGRAGLTEADMAPYQIDPQVADARIEAHFLGHYIPWDGLRNAQIANQMGMHQIMVSPANWWLSENQDNAQTGLHDHQMYRKYGYGRGAAQASIDIRHGRTTRTAALQWAAEYDGLFPEVYAETPIERVLERLEINEDYLFQHLDAFTNWDLFQGETLGRPRLVEGWT